jgi:hypothetical protein
MRKKGIKNKIRICPKGHNKDVVGSYSDGHCKECIKIHMAEQRRKNKLKIKIRKTTKTEKDKGSIIKCAWCSEPFYVYPSHLAETKYCSKKCYSLGKRKRFCKHGHDTWIVGRRKSGGCNACHTPVIHKVREPKPIKKVQFCPQGHDTFVVGRRKGTGMCNECSREQCRIYYDEHKEEMIQKSKGWIANNKERAKERNRVSSKLKYQTDVQWKIAHNLRSRLRTAIKKNFKAGSAVKDLGCLIPVFMEYIKKMFYDGMTWENWGEIWHLDHITPLWKFDLTNPEQFKQAVHYTNYQPLTIADHLNKTAKEAKELSKIYRAK